MRLALIVALALASAPSSLFAQNLYVETGQLVDVVAGKVLTGQCISIADDKIVAVAPCGPTPANATRVVGQALLCCPD